MSENAGPGFVGVRCRCRLEAFQGPSHFWVRANHVQYKVKPSVLANPQDQWMLYDTTHLTKSLCLDLILGPYERCDCRLQFVCIQYLAYQPRAAIRASIRRGIPLYESVSTHRILLRYPENHSFAGYAANIVGRDRRRSHVRS